MIRVPSPKINTAAIRRAMEKAVKDTATDVLAEAKRQVPREFGILKRSAVKDVETSGEQITVKLSFNTPYAAVQHEGLNFVHPRGGNAKYLENPLKQYGPKMGKRIEDAVRQVLR